MHTFGSTERSVPGPCAAQGQGRTTRDSLLPSRGLACRSAARTHSRRPSFRSFVEQRPMHTHVHPHARACYARSRRPLYAWGRPPGHHRWPPAVRRPRALPPACTARATCSKCESMAHELVNGPWCVWPPHLALAAGKGWGARGTPARNALGAYGWRHGAVHASAERGSMHRRSDKLAAAQVSERAVEFAFGGGYAYG